MLIFFFRKNVSPECLYIFVGKWTEVRYWLKVILYKSSSSVILKFKVLEILCYTSWLKFSEDLCLFSSPEQSSG